MLLIQTKPLAHRVGSLGHILIAALSRQLSSAALHLQRLTYSCLQQREKGGQITVQTKGSKTNVILLPEHLWEELRTFRKDASDESPIFKSRKGNALCVGQIQRIVRKIAEKAGITSNVSPHWMRHSHASHALDNGCPIHLIQRQLNHTSLATSGKYIHARPTESSSKYLK